MIPDETRSFVHRTALLPRHRLVLPADRELSPIHPVQPVTYLSGLDTWRLPPQGGKAVSFFLNVERSVLGQPWRARLDGAGEARALAIAQVSGQSDLMARVLAGRGVKLD